MNVLVTGIEGYLGSLLAPSLLRRGWSVRGIDVGFYDERPLYGGSPEIVTLRKDVRQITAEDLEGVDAVVHMGELSNDPVGQLAPQVTRDINYGGSMKLARACKEAGVQRYVYMSSCSVYGIATGSDMTETSPTNPQTEYAMCKTLVETEVAEMGDDDFSPTFLRNATAYGASPRMRFDIVLNNLAGLAWVVGEIRMTSDGTPWRPLVHGLDICHAIICVLEADRDVVHKQIFNVGDSSQNYQIKEIAETVAEVFPGCAISFGELGADRRSYRVSFEKIHERLPQFRCSWDARRGADELRELFERVDLDETTFNDRAFTRLSQLEHLLATERLDGSLYWRQ